MATKRSKKSFFSKMFKGFTMKKRSSRKSRRSRGRKSRRIGKRGG